MAVAAAHLLQTNYATGFSEEAKKNLMKASMLKGTAPKETEHARSISIARPEKLMRRSKCS
jgi:hypothetical protein